MTAGHISAKTIRKLIGARGITHQSWRIHSGTEGPRGSRREREGAHGPGALPLLGMRVGHLRFLLFSLYWLTETQEWELECGKGEAQSLKGHLLRLLRAFFKRDLHRWRLPSSLLGGCAGGPIIYLAMCLFKVDVLRNGCLSNQKLSVRFLHYTYIDVLSFLLFPNMIALSGQKLCFFPPVWLL